MDSSVLAGGVLVAGLVIFLVGATAWRLDYQRPLQESLPVIHADRRRWAWIHTWMIAGLVVTPAGLAGLVVTLDERDRRCPHGDGDCGLLVRRSVLDRVVDLPPHRGAVGSGAHGH